jgi:hypothetical protein
MKVEAGRQPILWETAVAPAVLLLATSRWPSQETAKPLGTQTMLSVADKQPTAKKKFGAGFPEKMGYVK